MSSVSFSRDILEQRVRDACRELEGRLESGERNVVEEIFQQHPEFAADEDFALELIYTEFAALDQIGEHSDVNSWLARFPQWGQRLERLLQIDAVLGSDLNASSVSVPGNTRVPNSTVTGSGERDGLDQLPATSLGRYELLDEIGHGGMGVVYRGRQLDLDRIVAIKMIRGVTISREERNRFRTEAEAAARLQHPNIVQIFEVGEHDGLPFLVMEFVHGGSLDKGSPLTPENAARLMMTLSRAMQLAHDAGIVHRDLKPANILLTQDGVPKITDFGLAKRSWEQEGGRTRTGAILGTPGYMAPEQATGKTRQIGPPVDIYALGAILYELLTGRPPFQADGVLETLEQVRFQDPVPPRRLRPRVPADLETICLKCLQKTANARYGTAEELAEDLRRYLERKPIQARPSTPIERAAKWARRRPAISLLLLAIFLVASLGFAGVVWQWRKAEQRGTELEIAYIRISTARADEQRQRELVDASHYFHRIGLAHREFLATHPERAATFFSECDDSDRRGWEWHYLKRLMQDGTDSLMQADVGIDGAMDVSPDGRWLAFGEGRWAGSEPGKTYVYDLERKKLAFAEVTHKGPIRASAFSPDGELLASSGGLWAGHGEVILRRTSDWKEVLRLGEDHFFVFHIDFSADNRYLAAATSKRVVIWDRTNNWSERVLIAHEGTVFALAFSPDHRFLASAARDGTVRIWDVRTWEHVQTLEGSVDFRSVAFRPDGKFLAAGGYDGKVVVWQVDEEFQEVSSNRWQHPINQVEFTPDGQFLAVALSRGPLHFVHPLTRRVNRTLHAQYSGLRLAFSPDGECLYTSDLNRYLKCHRLFVDARPLEFSPVEAHLSDMQFSPCGGFVALAPKLNTSIYGRGRNIIYLGDINEHEVVHRLEGHTGWVRSIAYSPGGERLVSAAEDHTLRLWNCRSGRSEQTWKGHNAPVDVVLFHPDGDVVLSGDDEGRLRCWNVDTGECFQELNVAETAIDALQFDPRGECFFVGTTDGKLQMRRYPSCDLIAEVPAHQDSLMSIAVNLDGTQLATTGKDSLVRIWKIDHSSPELEPVHVLRGHNNPVQSAAFSPDGSRLATSGDDFFLKLWDVETGYEAISLENPRHGRAIVRFSPDGQTLYQSHASGVLVIQAASIEGLSSEELEKKIRDWHHWRIDTCIGSGNFYGVLFHAEHLLREQPDNLEYQGRKIESLVELGRIEEALADLRPRIDASLTKSERYWYYYAVCLRAANQHQEYREFCATLCRQLLVDASPTRTNRIAWICALAPDGVDSFKEPLHYLELHLLDEDNRTHSALNTYGVLQYRLGETALSIETILEGIQKNNGVSRHEDEAFLSLAYRELGNDLRADEARAKAQAYIDEQLERRTGWLEGRRLYSIYDILCTQSFLQETPRQ